MKVHWLIAWTAVFGLVGLVTALLSLLVFAAVRGDLDFVNPEGD